MARTCSEVCTTVGSTPESARTAPARRAWSSPSGERSESTQPVKRFSRFQSLSPWRSRTSVDGIPAVWSATHRGSQPGNLRHPGGKRAESPYMSAWPVPNHLVVTFEGISSAPGSGPLRLIVAEDHGLMLEAIVNRLSADDGVRVIATVGDGRALVDTYTALHAAGEAPDVVLCDYSMPGLNGIEALRAILDRHPEA